MCYYYGYYPYVYYSPYVYPAYGYAAPYYGLPLGYAYTTPGAVYGTVMPQYPRGEYRIGNCLMICQ